MITPYDWQEGIGNRAQYIEGKLRHGSPVLAVSLQSGVLIYTRRRNVRKIFEIYDRLAFASIGQQSDIEALRSAAVEFAHQEGFNHSEQDVTIQRVINALSVPVKKAFADFNSAPLVARSLFAEVGDSCESDSYYVLNYDGDFEKWTQFVGIAGDPAAEERLRDSLSSIQQEMDPAAAASALSAAWEQIADDADDFDNSALEAEVMLIDRSTEREDRFRLLDSTI